MIYESEAERICMEAALRPLGEVMAEMGLDKKLSDLTRENALTIIEVVTKAYLLQQAKLTSAQLQEDIPF